MHELAETFVSSSGTNELPAATPASVLSRLICTAAGAHELVPTAAAGLPGWELDEAAGELPPAPGVAGAARDPHAATASVPAASAATASDLGLNIGCLPAAGAPQESSSLDRATAGQLTRGGTPSEAQVQAPAPVRPDRTVLTV